MALRISATIGAGSPVVRANSRSVLTSLRDIGRNNCAIGRSLMLLYFASATMPITSAAFGPNRTRPPRALPSGQ